jgi:hypothetical protein
MRRGPVCLGLLGFFNPTPPKKNLRSMWMRCEAGQCNDHAAMAGRGGAEQGAWRRGLHKKSKVHLAAAFAWPRVEGFFNNQPWQPWHMDAGGVSRLRPHDVWGAGGATWRQAAGGHRRGTHCRCVPNRPMPTAPCRLLPASGACLTPAAAADLLQLLTCCGRRLTNLTKHPPNPPAADLRWLGNHQNNRKKKQGGKLLTHAADPRPQLATTTTAGLRPSGLPSRLGTFPILYLWSSAFMGEIQGK